MKWVILMHGNPGEMIPVGLGMCTMYGDLLVRISEEKTFCMYMVGHTADTGRASTRCACTRLYALACAEGQSSPDGGVSDTYSL